MCLSASLSFVVLLQHEEDNKVGSFSHRFYFLFWLKFYAKREEEEDDDTFKHVVVIFCCVTT